MPNEFAKETFVKSEIPENEISEVPDASEMDALEMTVDFTEIFAETEAETGESEIPESLADVLQLTDDEKKIYSNLGKVVDMTVEGRVIGYKRGACYQELIPIQN